MFAFLSLFCFASCYDRLYVFTFSTAKLRFFNLSMDYFWLCLDLSIDVRNLAFWRQHEVSRVHFVYIADEVLHACFTKIRVILSNDWVKYAKRFFKKEFEFGEFTCQYLLSKYNKILTHLEYPQLPLSLSLCGALADVHMSNNPVCLQL